MRATLVAFALVLCTASADVLAQRQFQLLATLADSSGAEVTTVDPSALRVLENGVEGKVLKVEPVNRPLKIQILLDNGVGLGSDNIGTLRNSLRGLIEALPEDVEITVITTAPQPRPLVRATKNREELLQGVNRLAPDSGTGRFIESMHEAIQRFVRDREEPRGVIIALGTSSSGDNNPRDRDIQQILENVHRRRILVHTVMLAGGTRSASGGIIQAEVGQRAAEAAGGRYENIATGSRLATLLPELGAMVKASHGDASARQFRITVERPSGSSGELGKLSMATTGSLVVTGVSIE